MKTMEISEIGEMLKMLSETARQEVRDFTAYLLDRERRRKALVERVLKAEQNPDIVECKTPEEFIQAIIKAPDDDEEKG
jgi:predicted DNA-binding transcriptional regulator